jgi:outer membrane protein assembly factor BamB
MPAGFRVPAHGNLPSLIHAISPSGQGDVTASRLLWTSRAVGRVVATPIEKDGLLYVGDVGGLVYCLDAATGALVWEHDTYGAIWGSVLLAGDRLDVGNEDGTMPSFVPDGERNCWGRSRWMGRSIRFRHSSVMRFG